KRERETAFLSGTQEPRSDSCLAASLPYQSFGFRVFVISRFRVLKQSDALLEEASMSDEQGRGKVSRRSFIKGLGTGAAGAAVLGGGAALERADEAGAAAAAHRGSAGPGPVRITLNINGQARTAQVEPRTT